MNKLTLTQLCFFASTFVGSFPPTPPFIDTRNDSFDGGLSSQPRVSRPHLFPLLIVQHVPFSSRVHRCHFPPPLSSVIIALDSSSDGKCFSIPFSPPPPTPPRLPSFSLSHQANYISVSIETCLLNALSCPPLLFFVPFLFSASTCLLFPFSPASSWDSIFSLHLAPFIVCGPAAPSFGTNGLLLFTKRRELNQS